MKMKCPHCLLEPNSTSAGGHFRKFGFHYRRSDRAYVQRWRCLDCLRYFSAATFDPCYRQSTRHLNHQIYAALASLNSQRRTARTLKLSRSTLARKLKFLGARAEMRLHAGNRALPMVEHAQFDDLETHEHTKLKPLSITLAVSSARRILGVEVAPMPAKGELAQKSRAKYGRRKDERRRGRHDLFKTLLPLLAPCALIRSDQNPYYPSDVRLFFPYANHEAHRGRKPRHGGQGELKKGVKDPLWALNHTCAMFRANVNRLIRKTWCTTKKASCLRLHLYLYADYHNEWLSHSRPPRAPVLK